MNRILSTALLVGGLGLIFYAVTASNSAGPVASRLFTDSAADNSIWLLVGGVVSAVVGERGLIRGSKSL